MGKVFLKLTVLLLLCTALYSTPGCNTVKSVKEWVVELATETGEVIKGSAEYLYTAVRDAFFRYRIVDGVRYDKDNPLEGICVEERSLRFLNQEKGYDLTINLKGKKMVREKDSDGSPWMIDRDALPPELIIFFDEKPKNDDRG